MFIIKLYIQYRKYINLILTCFAIALLIIALDNIRIKKLEKMNNGMMDMSELLNEEGEESEETDDY